jgi:hypothetical protein
MNMTSNQNQPGCVIYNKYICTKSVLKFKNMHSETNAVVLFLKVPVQVKFCPAENWVYVRGQLHMYEQ